MASSRWMLSACFITASPPTGGRTLARKVAVIIVPGFASQFAGEGAELLDGRH